MENNSLPSTKLPKIWLIGAQNTHKHKVAVCTYYANNQFLFGLINTHKERVVHHKVHGQKLRVPLYGPIQDGLGMGVHIEWGIHTHWNND